MRKTKGADQLCGNGTADQCLCFRFIDSTIPILPKSDRVGNPEDGFSRDAAQIMSNQPTQLQKLLKF